MAQHASVRALNVITADITDSQERSGWTLSMYNSITGRKTFPRELKEHFHVRLKALRSATQTFAQMHACAYTCTHKHAHPFPKHHGGMTWQRRPVDALRACRERKKTGVHGGGVFTSWWPGSKGEWDKERVLIFP